MKLFQLADDPSVYGDRAGWWMVVTDDLADELAGPFERQQEAEEWIASQPGTDVGSGQGSGK